MKGTVMDNFSIIPLDDENRILIIICSLESPFVYIEEIAEKLTKLEFKGTVIIDELLHSGNTEERFIKCFFDQGFRDDSFSFLDVPKKSLLRKYICVQLKENPNLMEYSLSKEQMKLIQKNVVI